MTIKRLTLLQRGAKASGDVTSILPQAESAPIEVVSITRLMQGGRWRTEAMRSYDRPVMIWVTRGQGRMTVSGHGSSYGANTLVVLPKGTVHGFTTIGPVLGSIVFLPDDADMDWPMEPMVLRIRETQRQRELTGMVESMNRETEDGTESGKKALMHHAGLLSVWLSRTIELYSKDPGPMPGAQPDTAAHRLTEAFTALVERDFNRSDGVQHYAALLGVTPTHLSRVCRKVAGRPALDILVERRHFEACRLLKDTNTKISDIAQKCGFASAAYFTRAFKAKTGKSPSEFRRS